MTYDEAHRKLWDGIVKILSELKQGTRPINETNLDEEALKEASIIENKLPYLKGIENSHFCYACAFKYVIGTAPEDANDCPCFLKWGENISSTCLDNDALYTSYHRKLSVIRSKIRAFENEGPDSKVILNALATKFDNLLQVVIEIRDLPLASWYEPTEIDPETIERI